MISFEIKTEEINRIASQFQADSIEIDKATRRAISKSCKYIQTISIREIGKKLGIKQSELRRRITFRVDKTRLRAQVWYGMNRISLIRFNNPRQVKKGVKAGKIYREGAFLAPIKSNKPSVFKFQVFKRVGKSRLPIEKQMQEIDKEVKDLIDNNFYEKFWQRFLELFRQEIRWIVIQRS